MTSGVLQYGAVFRVFLIVLGLGSMLLAPVPLLVWADFKDTQRVAVEDVVRVVISRYGHQTDNIWDRVVAVLAESKNVEGILVLDKAGSVLHAEGNAPARDEMPTPAKGIKSFTTENMSLMDIYWPRPGLALDRNVAVRIDIKSLRNAFIGITLSGFALLVLFSFFITMMITLAIRARPQPVQPTLEQQYRAMELEVRERTKELKESEERFVHFACAASDWFWEMDENLRFKWFSERFTEITGVEQSALLGKTRRETGIPGVDGGVWQEHLQILDAHEPFRNFVHPRTKSDGKTVHVAISGVPVYSVDGKFTGYRGIGSDITYYYEHEQALQAEKARAEQASRAKSEFLSAMSHEFRTPLNAILGHAQIMQLVDNEGLSQGQQDQLSQIVKSGEHLLEQVENILVLGDILSGDKSMQLNIVSTNGVIDEAIESAAFLAEEQDIIIENKVASQILPDIMGDSPRVRRVLSGLLGNAIKYSPTESVVAVDAHVTGNEHMRFSVADQGCGIAEDLKPKVFQPFDRLGHENGVIPGVGVGLATFRRLVELMDGRMGFESEEGQGSIFWFELPLA